MGNAGSAIECCGPCTIDKSLTTRGIHDMEETQKPMDADPKQRLGNTSSPGLGMALDKNFTFRSMTRQDYFCLYDAIHTLVRQDEITKEQENVLYDLIGRQDKGLALAYQRYKEGGDPVVLLEPLKDRGSTPPPKKK